MRVEQEGQVIEDPIHTLLLADSSRNMDILSMRTVSKGFSGSKSFRRLVRIEI